MMENENKAAGMERAGEIAGTQVPMGCTCGDPRTVGVLHRSDGPCYVNPAAAGAGCSHPAPKRIQTGDGTPVDWCPDCGLNTVAGSAATPITVSASGGEALNSRSWIAGIDKCIAKLEQYWMKDRGCVADLREVRAFLAATKSGSAAPLITPDTDPNWKCPQCGKTEAHICEASGRSGSVTAPAAEGDVFAEMKRLHDALCFWLPMHDSNLPDFMRERIAADAYLLVGYDDMPDKKCAQELGWITTIPATEPVKAEAAQAGSVERENLTPLSKLMKLDLTDMHTRLVERMDYWMCRALNAQPASGGMTEVALIALLPGTYYMDPPDGGSVTAIEQLQRMAEDAARYRFLRKGFGDMGPDVDLHNAFVDGDEKMDAAIDAARAALNRTDGK